MTRTCVVMQPTYLPWCGYFDLIDQADVFVFLNDVQFVKQSWQQRNRIRNANGLTWLTVPVQTKGRMGQKIQETEISDTTFGKRHRRAIEHSYSRLPHCAEVLDLLQPLADPPKSLDELNRMLVNRIKRYLSISTECISASELRVCGDRTTRLAGMCKELDCDTYLTTPGSLAYLESELEPFERTGIEILVHCYEHPVYTQAYAPFIPYASVVDLLCSQGATALKTIRHGRRPSQSLRKIGENTHEN